MGQRRSGWGRHRVRNQSIDADDTARPRTGRRYASMTRIGAVALVVGVPLAFATGAPAKSSHKPVKCRAGYVRRSVQVAERRHGRIVRRHSRIVYTRVWRCVKAAKPKPSPPGSRPVSSPVSSPTTPGAPSPPLGPVVPSPPSPTAPVNTALPAISGNAAEGSTLTASPGAWTNAPTSYGYQWQRCDAGASCQSVTGATHSTYLVGTADVGSTVRVSVSASNASGSASATSAAAGPVAPVPPTRRGRGSGRHRASSR